MSEPERGIATTPVLWLYGADAVGKSTVAWEIYDSLASNGTPAAYVDTDYLGFCSPMPGTDSSALIASNLASMWPNFRAVGARCLIVSGIVVGIDQRRRYESVIPGAHLTLCRLRASPRTMAERILRRGIAEGAGTDGAASGLSVEGLREYGERAADFAALLDAHDISDFTVDTDGVSVPDVSRAVLQRADGWPNHLGGQILTR